MSRISTLIISLVFIQLSIVSCKKKNNPAPVCNLTGIVSTAGTSISTFTAAYDNDGKIAVFEQADQSSTATRIYTYTGNVVMTSTTSGGSTTTDSIVLNSNGLMMSDLAIDGSVRVLTTYTYSGTQVQQSVMQVNGHPVDTITYTWSSGDLVSSSDGNTYSYNISKPSATGDYFQLLQLISNGAPFIKCAHQLKRTGAGSSLANFNYDYDNTGNITELTVTQGASVQTLIYQYSCN